MNRLFGQETEYAIRYSADEGYEKPSNQLIYDAIQDGIQQLVKTQISDRHNYQKQFFVENGGTFNYEYQPFAPDSGLIEGGTPECYTPTEFILYQKAQERLLLTAIPLAQKYLERKGFQGGLGLIKNCRDQEGHIYGTQENYELNIAAKKIINIYRAGLGLVILPFFLLLVIYWPFIISLIITVLILVFATASIYFVLFGFLRFLGTLLSPLKNLTESFQDFGLIVWSRLEEFMESGRFENFAIRFEYKIFYPLANLTLIPYIFWQRLFVFKQYRKRLTAFLISRTIISGTGSLMNDSSYALSEKGVAIKRTFRSTLGAEQRPIYDNGNLVKEAMMAGMNILFFKFEKVKQLFKQKQRLQLGFSDSNRAQVAEYLKVGTTLLVLKMLEQGFIHNEVPIIKKPIKALKKINFDPGLKTRIDLINGTTMTALELQKWYLEAAQRFIKQSKDIHIEFYEVVRLWQETLTLLEQDPGQLIGRIDWITKRYLLETSGKNADYDTKKKIDIGYHELGTGYFDLLENKGLAPVLVTEEEVNEAVRKPSSPLKTRLRSRFIKSLAYEGQKVKITWDSVQIGNWRNRKIINFNEMKKQNSDNETHDLS